MRRAGIDLEPASDAGDNALKSLLQRVVVYEKAGAVIPGDLLQFGLYGSVLVIATSLLALVWSGPEAVRSSDFYLVLGGTVASVIGLMKSLAIPAIVAGICLLALDLVLMKVRTSARWRSLVVGQAAVGGFAGMVGTAFLALVLLNLVLWIIIVCLVLVLIGFMLSVVAGG